MAEVMRKVAADSRAYLDFSKSFSSAVQSADKDSLLVHWDLVRFLKAEQAELDTRVIAEITYGKKKEDGSETVVDLMMYLYKLDDVIVVQVYTDDDKFDVFECPASEAGEAIAFLDSLSYTHPEYKARPMRELA